MMDQLASVGVEFQDETINRIFNENRRFYEHPPKDPPTLSNAVSRPTRPWAIESIYEKHYPVRPWGLGKIYNSDTGIYLFTGRINRTPGQYKRADPDTGLPTNVPMTHTNERIHSSVRIRLDLEGLGPDDKSVYDCQALLAKGCWQLRQARVKVYDPIRPDADWGGQANGKHPAADPEDEIRWIWRWAGPDEEAPHVRTMVEENLGPYERRLLLLNTGMYQFILDVTSEGLS